MPLEDTNNADIEIKEQSHLSIEDIANKGKVLLEDTVDESLPESQPEDTQDESEPMMGEEVAEEETVANTSEEEEEEIIDPFHKHPRWIARSEELKELRERERQERERALYLESQLIDRENKLKEYEQYEVVDDEVPEWFSDLYGDNKNAWIKYQKSEIEREERIANKVKEEAQRMLEPILRERQQQDATARELSRIEKEIGKLQALGLDFDRNALLKVMGENRDEVRDENNELDFTKGYLLLKQTQATKKKVSNNAGVAKKKEAALVTESSQDTENNQVWTAESLRNTSWN